MIPACFPCFVSQSPSSLFWLAASLFFILVANFA